MEMTKDQSFGIIPIFKNLEGDFLFCLVEHQGEHWGFPKGHPNPGEREEETAKRELEEETGITDIKIISDKFFNQKYIFEKDGIVYDKSVKYFPGFVSNINTTTPDDFKHEISGMKWLAFKEARELATFDNAKVMLDELEEYVNKLSFTSIEYNHFKNIKWIFFDIGGVLADESEFLKIRENYNFEIVKYFEPEITKEEVLAVWPQASGMIGDLDVNVVSLALKDKSKITEAVDLIKIKRSEVPSYYDLLKIRKEVIEVIPKLAQKYKLGIVANQNSKVKEKLEEVDLLKYFQNVDVSGDFKLNKPDPLLYKKIFEITGASPMESVMVDDNIERGLLPAKKLGMITVWYKLNDRNDIPVGVIDYTITSLKELLYIL